MVIEMLDLQGFRLTGTRLKSRMHVSCHKEEDGGIRMKPGIVEQGADGRLYSLRLTG